MALIDVVKCTMGPGELIAKFPSNDLRIGTQLVVYPGQTALFVKGGKIYDEFKSGTYTLTTSNIPLLNAIINLPFGGDSPFQAEVWFVNQVAILNSKWGTATPLQIEDPKYEVIVPLRSYGQYGFNVANPRVFLESLVSNMVSFDTEKIKSYFKGKVLSQLTNIVSNKLVKDNISILNINSHLQEIGDYCKERISSYFNRYGIEILAFDVISISPKENDPSFIKLKEAKDLAARLKITGKDVYQMERSFNVLDNAAQNEGGSSNLMNAGLGLGMGVNIGKQMGDITQNLNTNPVSVSPSNNPNTPPPLPGNNNIKYFVGLNGQQIGPLELESVRINIQEGKFVEDTLVWKQGMAAWDKLANLPEFKYMFSTCPPPLPNINL
ncbi:MAG: SPFH domain-containing protein [Bacteroidales bacterium]|nr:SPFH domain-containing protein [Bacteroidales bacterium]